MRELVADQRERYSMVIIDSPPVAHLADASILAAISDGIVLVSRVGVTNRVCTDGMTCPHSENTDLLRFQGGIILVPQKGILPRSPAIRGRAPDRSAPNDLERPAAVPPDETR